jgi:hypothetical protein
MKRFLCGLGTLLALGLAATPARAQYYSPPPSYYSPSPYYDSTIPVSYPTAYGYGGYPPGPRVAPDMCGGYFYCTNGCTWYGPSYCVRPPFEPFNGIRPTPPPTPVQFAAQKGLLGGPAGVALPINPWTRSPRDFFMWGEAQQERHTRETRPPFVP